MMENEKIKESESIVKNRGEKDSEKPTELQQQLVGKDAELEVPQQVKKVFEMGAAMFSRGQAYPPFMDKFDADHIHKWMDYIQRDDDNLYKLKSTNRFFNLAYFILGIAVFIFLIIFLLPKKPEMLVDILKTLVIFIGGLGGGIGVKFYWDKKQKR